VPAWKLLLLFAVLACLLLPAPAQAAQGEADMYAGDIGQAVAAILIFLVLLGILGKFAWKPIIAQLRQREEGVAKQLAEAEKQQKESQELLAEYRARLDRAESDAQRLVEDSRKQAARDRQKLLDQAQGEVEKQSQQMKREIEQAKKQALRELHAQTAELAADIAASVLSTQIDEQMHRKLVDGSLAQIRTHARENA
jgi:F-type H+-transporting ATPase subunit b